MKPLMIILLFISISMMISMTIAEQQQQQQHYSTNKKQQTLSTKLYEWVIPRLRNRINEIWQNRSNDIIEWKHFSILRLKHCYNPEYSGEDLNLFHLDIMDVVKKFFKHSKNLLVSEKVADIVKRILSFVRNMKYLIKMIRDCIDGMIDDGIDGNLSNTVLGITSLSAYTPQEMNSLSNVYINQINNNFDDDFGKCNCQINGSIPQTFDWRKYGIVTSVKNQQLCGSCYAFASIATVESLLLRHQMNNLKTNDDIINLSEQHLVDCVGQCHGSNVIKLFNFIRNVGVTYEQNERYMTKAKDCHNYYQQRIRIRTFCFNFKRVHSDEEIQSAILRYGPIFGAAAFNKQFQFLRGPYRSGRCKNQRKDLHHSIVIVGWTENYWIIKNSWGKNWGIDGYLYLARKPTNNCGVGWIIAAPIGLIIDR